MFDFSQTQLQSVIVHHVGNKTREEELMLAQKAVDLGNELVRQILSQYFLSPFKENNLYNFSHDTDVRMNELYTYCANLFEAPERLVELSAAVAQHLYQSSEHPKIKSGELSVAYFRDVVLEDEITDAIGIFKTETHETYLKLERADDSYAVKTDNGVNINKLDKGCLIFNTDKEKGYVVAVLDASNKTEAHFWKDDFLQLRPREDHYFHTQQFLTVVKNYIADTLIEDIKPEGIALQQKAVKFFKEESEFDLKKFEEEVLEDSEIIETFQTYKQAYVADTQHELKEDFKISTPAVKSVKKQFKNQIKLDNHFVVNILSREAVLRKGFDEQSGMNYYQLFFEEEVG